MTEKPKSYKDTLNLPRTKFSMKANLPQREPEMLKKWEEADIYKTIIDERKASDKQFILHDGPPYANGHIHVGHVLNKMLKDICVKYHTMNGKYAPYVPGWDCHGLPVEHQLFKELGITKHEIDKVKFRKKAHDYAVKFVKIQAEEFKRLGIFGEWDNPYLTLTKSYEADILFALADLYEKGYIYKDLKPVNWCKTCETALAEAEVEHNDKTSPSIYVKFASSEKVGSLPTYFVIWTTTPWTLLANVAVAVHPEFTYAAIEVDGEVWIVAEDLVDRLIAKAGKGEHKVLEKISGTDLVSKFTEARHPFIDRTARVVLADYVTKEDGTGCVHTAPGHGQDDYTTGKKYGLPTIMPVDDFGKFTEEAGEFAGKDVIAANKDIVAKMQEEGSLIKAEDVVHSYPHCWRCKEPIIFRATEQWFMRIDHNDLRKRLMETIENEVKWVPAIGSDRIGSMVEGRPDWCLSRQRHWGVPIPAFKCKKCSETFTNAEIIKKVASLTETGGADVWFEKSQEEFLLAGTVCKKCGSGEFEKEDNILDVWFDSGVSHRAVLERREELSFPADLYLEGSDQHRGWFQSSLITSMGIKGESPYRSVLTHGFVVDGEGKKMSKSTGNVISPKDVMKKYGADILRLWVSSSDYEADIKLSSEILERLADGYRKIRNTFRFLLSNLSDFDTRKDMVELENLSEIDRWMLSQLYKLIEDTTRYYENYEFHKVYRAVYSFCTYEVSAFYLDVLKDTLYTALADSKERRSSQTVIFRVLHVLNRIMAPILSFTTEEVWTYMDFQPKETTVHLAFWPGMDKNLEDWKDEELGNKWKKILDIRDKVLKLLEGKREKGLIGSSLEGALVLYSDDVPMQTFVKENIRILPMLFKVSQVEIVDKQEDDMEDVSEFCLKIAVRQAQGKKCERCWSYDETVGGHKELPDVCDKCYDVIIERSKNG